MSPPERLDEAPYPNPPAKVTYGCGASCCPGSGGAGPGSRLCRGRLHPGQRGVGLLLPQEPGFRRPDGTSVLIELLSLDELLEIAAEGDAEGVGDRVGAVARVLRHFALHGHRPYSA